VAVDKPCRWSYADNGAFTFITEQLASIMMPIQGLYGFLAEPHGAPLTNGDSELLLLMLINL